MGDGASTWRPIFEAFESRDDERIVAHCDPEIEWHTQWPGMERVFHGWEGVTRWRAAIDEALAVLSLHMDVWKLRDGKLLCRRTYRDREDALAGAAEIAD